MKIAQIAPLYEAVPPSLYGGTERIVAHLTNALVELGHEVTLFASAEAHTRATLVPVRDQAIRLDRFPLKSDRPLTCPCCMNFICAGTNSIFCISMSISSIFRSSKIWRREP
jgi:glycosyltransferase involved in cell wall biosynthesis